MTIHSKEDLKKVIAYERMIWTTRMYPHGAPKHIFSPTLLFMRALRTIEYYDGLPKGKKISVRYLYFKIVYKFLSQIKNVMILPHVFEEGLLIAHLQNIVVSSRVHVGKCACVFQNTTIGIKLGFDDRGKCPQLGEGVTICTGACLFGDIQIGDGITIGANSVVTKSFSEPNVVIGGIPAKIISRKPGWSMLSFVEEIKKNSKDL